MSLDKTVGDDGDATFGDLDRQQRRDARGRRASPVSTAQLLDELLGTLDERGRYAVEARFGLLDGEKQSFREIGEHLGVTAEAARRLVNRAIDSLRDDAMRMLAA